MDRTMIENYSYALLSIWMFIGICACLESQQMPTKAKWEQNFDTATVWHQLPATVSLETDKFYRLSVDHNGVAALTEAQ